MKMTDKKLTDEEIIKALEYCNTDRNECNKCVLQRECERNPFYSPVAEQALDLINRQKAELEQWQEEANNWKTIACQQSVDALSFSELIENAYKQGAKAFVEKLKKEILSDRGYDVLQQGTIDNLLKEMVGEE